MSIFDRTIEFFRKINGFYRYFGPPPYFLCKMRPTNRDIALGSFATPVAGLRNLEF